MLKWLIPIDGSENSMRALRYAVSLAKTNGPISIHVVTVHEEPIVYGEIAIYVSREQIIELQRRQCETILETPIAMLNSAGVTFSSEILEGPIAATIAKCADDLACDGIVMGTRGMTSIGGLLLGSVATKVVHAANVPVTLVK